MLKTFRALNVSTTLFCVIDGCGSILSLVQILFSFVFGCDDVW